jgi:hypothetical protein
MDVDDDDNDDDDGGGDDDDDDDLVETSLMVMAVLMEGTCHMSNCRHNPMPCRVVFRQIFYICIQTI